MKKSNLQRCIKIVIIVCLSLIWPGIGVTDDARTYLFEGTEYLRQKEFDYAITALTLAIDHKSDYPVEEQDERTAEAYNNRGLAYYEKNQISNAVSDFNQAIQLNSKDEKAHNNLALVYYDQGEYDIAQTYYEKALECSTEEKPYHVDVYNNLGIIYAKKNMYVAAMNAYNNATRITEEKNLDYTYAYYNRGNLFYNLKKYDQAIADYTVTIEYCKNAENVEFGVLDAAYYNRGLSKYNKGQYNEAIEDYNRAIQLNPDYMWAHYAKGFAYFMLNEYTQALAAYQNVVGSEIDSYARFGIGLVYCRKGQFDTGLSYLKESCESKKCPEACQTLKENMYAYPGLFIDFELPL